MNKQIKKIPGMAYCSVCHKPIGKNPGDHVKEPSVIISMYDAPYGLERAKFVKSSLFHPECFKKNFDIEQLEHKIKLYSEALKVWGIRPQITMVLEEMNELGVEVCKLLRNDCSLKTKEKQDALVDEIADVEIMLEQLKFIYNLVNSVEIQKQEKLEKLETKLKNPPNLITDSEMSYI